VAVDVAILTARRGHLFAVVVEREAHPARGRLALPGGFVGVDEALGAAARRVLASKAGLAEVFLEQLYSFGEPSRDPRTRVISVAYYALVDWACLSAASESRRRGQLARIIVDWEGETGGPVGLVDEQGGGLDLAFDHDEILGTAVKRIRGKLNYSPIGFQLLPDLFTLRQLQEVHETVLGRPLNKDSFRRRMLSSGQLEATGERESDVEHRPAELYRFARRSAV
jgi:8-oxo-dGTP diphosphatase